MWGGTKKTCKARRFSENLAGFVNNGGQQLSLLGRLGEDVLIQKVSVRTWPPNPEMAQTIRSTTDRLCPCAAQRITKRLSAQAAETVFHSECNTLYCTSH